MHFYIILTLTLALSFAAPTATGRTWYIFPDGSGDAPTIQAGIDSASVGDTVLVGCGTYNEYDLTMKSGVCLRSETGEAECVRIQAAWEDRVFYCQDVDSAASIEGLTITEGIAEFGGGIYFENSFLTVSHCEIIENECYGGDTSFCGGGGIFCEASSPMLVNCVINSNSVGGHYFAQGIGGGVCCSNNSSPIFMDCTIDGNAVGGDWCFGGGIHCLNHSAPSFTNCSIYDNNAGGMLGIGGGVYCCGQSSPTFTNCTINRNSAQQYYYGYVYSGGGVFCWEQSSPTFTNCIISHNFAYSFGGGIRCGESSPSFTNCTIVSNSADSCGGVYCSGSFPTFNNTIIAFSSGTGVYFSGSSGSVVEYCDFCGNGSNFGGDIPAGLGLISATNANGDPCDQYYNIFLNPLFVDSPTDDMHLSDGSPCIGAGDPTDPPVTDIEGNPRPNPPESNPDIGAYENPYGVPSHVTLPIASLPTAYALHPNWPNPFNPMTEISYHIARTEWVSLRVFNLLGQEVAVLADEIQTAGAHAVRFDGSNLPSGIYLCRMEAPGFSSAHKMVLLK